MKITIIIYIRLFNLFPNLITKESYNWWVTKRVWGFRPQISKAKYLKVLVANIGKLQENTATLCRKISQNVDQTYQEASGEHRGTVQNGCETLRISAIRGSGYVWSGKLKRPPLPFGVRRRMWYIRVEWRRWNIRMECRREDSRCETSGWNGGAAEFRMWYIRVEWQRAPLSGWNVGGEISGWNVGVAEFRMWYIRVEWRRAPLFGFPQGEAHDTRDHHTPDDSISYPDMLSGYETLTKVHKPCCVIPKAYHNPHSAALRWCVRTPCPDDSISYPDNFSLLCHGFQRTLFNLGLLWWSNY